MDQTVSKTERTWAMLCHVSTFAGYVFPMGNIIAPLLVWLLKREEYPMVDDQGKESLNFQISITIYVLCALLLCLVVIGIPILIGLVIFELVMVIIASIRANDGERYRYPMTIRLVK